MIISKCLNNNAAIAINPDGQEIVVMGKGLAFQKSKGDQIDDSLVAKTFVYKDAKGNPNTRLVELINEIPYEYLSLTEKIVEHAQERLKVKFNDVIYLTLPDHIYFAVTNTRQNIAFRNSLLFDIKRIYKNEFDTAVDAIEMIYQQTNVLLPLDEAASIALHFINALGDQDIPEMVEIMKIVEEVSNIVKYTMNIEFDEDSLAYYRFINHLKFFAKRVVMNNFYTDDDLEIIDTITKKHQESCDCALKISEYVFRTYSVKITNEEILYLTIHIERLVSKK